MSITLPKKLKGGVIMDKIYGYKQSDVIGLAEFLKTRQGESLSQTFSNYALKSGKAKGTVRNLYYALAKLSKEDKRFCQEYLGGKPILVSPIVEFNDGEERELIKNIISAKCDGRSVRSIINDLAKGDSKRALRYQNKYRNAIKNKPTLINEIVDELESEGVQIKKVFVGADRVINAIPEEQLGKLKTEINNLFERVSAKTRKENNFLKERIAFLESENLRLMNMLYKGEKPCAMHFFHKEREQTILN